MNKDPEVVKGDLKAMAVFVILASVALWPFGKGPIPWLLSLRGPSSVEVAQGTLAGETPERPGFRSDLPKYEGLSEDTKKNLWRGYSSPYQSQESREYDRKSTGANPYAGDPP